MPESKAMLSPNTKRLTGATMNMRFMTRSAEKDAVEKEENLNDNMEWSKPTAAQHQISQLDKCFALPEKASDVDMYGISADLIGRRSFKKFNVAVEESFQNSLDVKIFHKSRSKVKNSTVSDEEMIERYKKYVRGGDSLPAPIGGLGNKDKKKRRNSKSEGRSGNLKKRNVTNFL